MIFLNLLECSVALVLEFQGAGAGQCCLIRSALHIQPPDSLEPFLYFSHISRLIALYIGKPDFVCIADGRVRYPNGVGLLQSPQWHCQQRYNRELSSFGVCSRRPRARSCFIHGSIWPYIPALVAPSKSLIVAAVPRSLSSFCHVSYSSYPTTWRTQALVYAEKGL